LDALEFAGVIMEFPGRDFIGNPSMILLAGIGFYALAGLVTALAFVTFGVIAVLPHPVPVSIGARILLVPGAAALWPYVLVRWVKSRGAS
jgi:hypothetical protein